METSKYGIICRCSKAAARSGPFFTMTMSAPVVSLATVLMLQGFPHTRPGKTAQQTHVWSLSGRGYRNYVYECLTYIINRIKH